jgi:hypothetical protein
MGWARVPHRRAAPLGALLGFFAVAVPARAQQVELAPLIPGQPPLVDQSGAVIESAPPPDLPPRPRMSLAAGMGVSFDSAGLPDGTHPIPAFFGIGGFGDGLAGFELGAFSSSAQGRYTMAGFTPIDRLALDAFGVVRPAARVRPDDLRYRYRVLRTLAVELGLGYERDGTTTASGSRAQIHTGARVELPLTPAGQASELRLRIAYRRAFGLYTPMVAGAEIGDSNELYGALAVVF